MDREYEEPPDEEVEDERDEDRRTRREEDREDDREDEEMRKVINPRVDTSAELILAITKPTVRQKYMKFVSRDLAVSNIPKNRLDMLDQLRRYVSLISDFIFLDTPQYPLLMMADVYNADLKAYLNLLRSVGGFERKQQTTITSRKESFKGEEKGNRWGMGK